MIDLAVGIHDPVKAALAPMLGGYTREEDGRGRALVPSWWLHADSSAPLNALQDAGVVFLDIWAPDRQELADALAEVEFLREFEVLGVGSYRRESIAVQDEDTGEAHGTVVLSCSHFAGAEPPAEPPTEEGAP